MFREDEMNTPAAAPEGGEEDYFCAALSIRFQIYQEEPRDRPATGNFFHGKRYQ